MHKIYTLSTCDTSRRILDKIDQQMFIVKDIKKQQLLPEELDELKSIIGSYEALFSRRSRSYSKMGLKGKALKEEEYRELILQDYTFLKRPVVLIDGEVFAGNQKKNVEALYSKLRVHV